MQNLITHLTEFRELLRFVKSFINFCKYSLLSINLVLYIPPENNLKPKHKPNNSCNVLSYKKQSNYCESEIGEDSVNY